MSRVEFRDDAAERVAKIAWNTWIKNNRTDVRRAVQQETPVDLGGLKGSVNTRVLAKEGPLGTDVLRVEANAEYAAPVHQGHGFIYPKNASVLSWLNRLTGERVFAKFVRPVKGRPFILNGLKKLGLRTKAS